MSAQQFGAWASPISAAKVVEAAARLGGLWVEVDVVWWDELRPDEGGRVQVVRDGVDVLPDGWSARTRVHEYGGGAWCVWRDSLVFSAWADQRLWRLDPGGAPEALTPEPAESHGLRYADGRVAPDGSWLVCVRERHDGDAEAVNEIVRVPLDGSGDVTVLVAGPDFVSTPRLDAAAGRMCWLQWEHPDMPWDGTELWVADIALDGALAGPRRIAGGRDESIHQPEWGPDHTLHFVSDRTGWWNLYRGEDAEPVSPIDAEIGQPQWVFGQSRYAFLADGRIACAYASRGFDHLAVIDPATGDLADLDVDVSEVAAVAAAGEDIVAIAASTTSEPQVVRVRPGDPSAAAAVVRAARDLELDPEWISVPESISFPTGGGRTAHAHYYPPTNPDMAQPEGERPPLLVLSHGGPTSSARPQLNLGTQYWTSRGFAVVDVDYGGSTGYGRTYRHLLDRAWGVVDTEDCIAAARHLVDTGLVDPDRLCIRGGSAGGYTTLCALTFHDVFAAGASHYGVADLAALARDTHKFESRYLDRLVGPWPDAAHVYRERSPIHHVDRLSCPLIVLQGLEDEIVPPAQAEMIVAALEDKGVPVEYVAFAGEQHGFRQAGNIIRALEAELAFYGRVLGFVPADGPG